MPKPSPILPSEQEVLENVTGYEVRKFRGEGNYYSEMFGRDELERARERRRELMPQAMIYAHGIIPSRGGIPGVCFVP